MAPCKERTLCARGFGNALRRREYFSNYCGTADRFSICETPIDLLSFLTLHRYSFWQKHSDPVLAACRSGGLPALYPGIRKLFFCPDNDFGAKKPDGSPDENHGQAAVEHYCRWYEQKGYESGILTPD